MISSLFTIITTLTGFGALMLCMALSFSAGCHAQRDDPDLAGHEDYGYANKVFGMSLLFGAIAAFAFLVRP